MDMDRVCIVNCVTPTSMCLGVVGRGKVTLETTGTTCPELTSLEKTKMGGWDLWEYVKLPGDNVASQ